MPSEVTQTLDDRTHAGGGTRTSTTACEDRHVDAPSPSLDPARIRVLVFSTLYPNAIHPTHGVFVENRLRALLSGGGVEARVLAPVPWFPLTSSAFGRYAAFARVPRREIRFDVAVEHPRFVVVPKIGTTLTPFTLYAAAAAAVRRLLRAGFDFELIDAHYFYPDGVAAVMLARRFGKRVTITARGTDINLIAQSGIPRRWVRWAAERADGLICVSHALKERLSTLGIDPARIRVMRNGVDTALFRPRDRDGSRARLGLEPPVLLAVGSLIPLKGQELMIQALHGVPEATLVLVGSGPEETALKRLAEREGLGRRVRFLGEVRHQELPPIYGAADLLILASSREGWPNVLLEAMACGTPVVAVRVGGTPEIVAAPEAGMLVDERSTEALTHAIRRILANPPDRRAVRAYAERFDWRETTEAQVRLFADLCRPNDAKSGGSTHDRQGGRG